MNGSTALVTGGCGFVGAPLCNRLVDLGHDVVIVDNFSRGTSDNLSSSVRNRATIEEIDIRDASALSRCFRRYQPDVVYHLAAMHFIPDCDANPAECISVNVEGTQRVLDACRLTPSVRSFVLASTAAVYAPSTTPHSEESALGPVDIYGMTKLWDEQLVNLFHKTSDIGLGVARLFNVFGPGETNPHFIPSIVQQAAEGSTLRLGNLATKRDYVYTDDVASALVRLAEAACHHSILTCNVGSEIATDGNTMVDMVAFLLGRDLQVDTDPARVRVSDRPLLQSDCRRAHNVLGWQAKVSLLQGLHETIERPIAHAVARAA